MSDINSKYGFGWLKVGRGRLSIVNTVVHIANAGEERINMETSIISMTIISSYSSQQASQLRLESNTGVTC